MSADRSPAPLIPSTGYLRVSMKREAMISPEIQRASISRHARQEGRLILEWVEDRTLPDIRVIRHGTGR